MPFLRAGIVPVKERISQVPAVISVPSIGRVLPPPITRFVPSQSGDRTLDLPLDDGIELLSASSAIGKLNKEKGAAYEQYVGSIYKKYGYLIDYNGIKKNGHDRGVDLICHSGRYTVLVQCKCYSTGSISVNTIYHFFGSSRHYALKNPHEVVSSSLWTSLELKPNSEALIAATELGIKVYQGCKLPSQ